MQQHPFLPYGKPSILPSEVARLQDIFSSPMITRGPQVLAFEQTIAEYCGAKFAVAFNSGSSALSACAYAADVKEGDKVVSTPNTFVASVGSSVQRGALPVFVDIDRSTGILNSEQALSVINAPSSRGRSYLVLVHFAGIAEDMQSVSQKVKNPNTIIVEDACHALGSTYPTGEKVGSCTYSDFTVFSFHPVKTITTGEGGMVTTNDEKFFHRLKLFRDNGIVRCSEKQEIEPWFYESFALTGNYNLTEFQASLGLSQMERLEDFIEKRRRLMKCYRRHLKEMPNVRMFSEEADERSAYHLAVLQIDFEAYGKSRSEVMKELSRQGIGSQVHYIPLYKHPVFQKMCGEIDSYFLETEKYYSQALSLPLYFDLEEEDVGRVCKTLKEIVKK